MLWSRVALAQQFARVSAAGWLPHYEEAGKKYGFSVPVLLAVSSRETNCKNILGDGGHGHGIMQIDDRSYPVWCSSGLWKDVKEAIRMGAAVLHQKQLRIMPSIPEEDRLRVALAAYNAGEGHAAKDYWAGVVDRHTTGQNYSKDVLAREKVFAELYQHHG